MMETFTLILLAIGSWALVIGMITTLGKLYTVSNTVSHETAQDSAPDTDKVVFLDGANDAPAEDQVANDASRAAA